MPYIPYLPYIGNIPYPSIVTILTIHTIQTIHTVISNIPYPTDLHTILTIHTITTIHAIHSIHSIPTIHTKHTILSKHAIPDRPYTPYIPNIPYHTTLPPHHRGFHTPTTPQGGRGKISYGGSIWDPSHGGGEGGWQGLVHIYYITIVSLYPLTKMGGSSGAYAQRGRRTKAEAALRDMSRAGLGVEGWDPWELREKP